MGWAENEKQSPNLFYGVSMHHSHATVVYQRPGMETFERLEVVEQL